MPFGVPPLLLLQFHKAACLRASGVMEFTNDIFPLIFKNQFGSRSHPSVDAATLGGGIYCFIKS